MTTDEGFREIQLNGKQLVFLFMAAAVISVVIFLLGVMVGRNSRSEHPAQAEVAPATIAPDPVGPPPAAQTAAPAAQAPPASEPPPPADELTYFDRLQKNDTPPETLKSSSSEPALRPAPPPKAAPPPAAEPQIPLAETHSAPASAGEPSGPGFAVQVAAYRDRREADTLVKRLVGKGYPAFVLAPTKGAPLAMYRVRVGKYKDKAEADAVFHRLESEEQFKPWLVR